MCMNNDDEISLTAETLRTATKEETSKLLKTVKVPVFLSGWCNVIDGDHCDNKACQSGTSVVSAKSGLTDWLDLDSAMGYVACVGLSWGPSRDHLV